MFRSALVSFAFSSTWEALQADGWSDKQLRLMQSEWQKHEFLSALHETLLIERAITQSTINQARHSSLNINQMVGASGGGGPVETALEVTRETAQNLWEDTTGMLWSWLASYNDEYVCLRAYQNIIEQERSAGARRSYKIAHDALFDANNAQSLCGGSSLAQIMIGLWSNCLSRPFIEETERDLSVTAIALKRYSLRHSKLPSQLSELVPEFLDSVPIDSMDGQSLRYRPNTNGTFLLYSVGKDGRDDGGDTTSVKENAKGYSAARDFIWPVAADPEEVMRYNEETGNKIQKVIEQKARRSRSTNRTSSIEK
jgi:hypothetical protein